MSRVLRTLPFLMEDYLHGVIFPKLLRHTNAKLSASGQDLGSEVLCGSRLGFSGTPNDLMPRALGNKKNKNASMLGAMMAACCVLSQIFGH